MEGVFKADHRGTFRIGAGDLDGIFDALGASVDKNGFLRKIPGSQRVQFFRDSDVPFVGRDSKAEMQELIELLAKGGHHTRRAMANVKAADTSGKIEIAIAVDIFDCGTIRTSGENGRRIGGAARDGGFAAGR